YGTRFQPDETIQVGWMLLRLAANAEGDLLIQEPDFAGVPIRWLDGANRCVRSLSLQRAVCDEFGVEPEFPSVRDAASATEPFPTGNSFTMSRSESEGAHSGWT